MEIIKALSFKSRPDLLHVRSLQWDRDSASFSPYQRVASDISMAGDEKTEVWKQKARSLSFLALNVHWLLHAYFMCMYMSRAVEGVLRM